MNTKKIIVLSITVLALVGLTACSSNNSTSSKLSSTVPNSSISKVAESSSSSVETVSVPSLTLDRIKSIIGNTYLGTTTNTATGSTVATINYFQSTTPIGQDLQSDFENQVTQQINNGTSATTVNFASITGLDTSKNLSNILYTYSSLDAEQMELVQFTKDTSITLASDLFTGTTTYKAGTVLKYAAGSWGYTTGGNQNLGMAFYPLTADLFPIVNTTDKLNESANSSSN